MDLSSIYDKYSPQLDLDGGEVHRASDDLEVVGDAHLLRVELHQAQFSIYEHPLGRNVKRFRGGLVSKAHILLYHSTLGSRVIKKKKYSGMPISSGSN